MNLYICSEDTAKALIQYTSQFHYINLSDGMVVVTVEFSEATHEIAFSSQPDVLACPHPFSGQTFEQHASLKLLSPLGITADDTHYTAREKLSKIVPHFKV